MAYPKGAPRPPGAGRRKGTPNKKSKSLMEMCERKGVNVFESMLDFVLLPCEPAIRLQALKELAQYLYPKRKAIEHSGEISNPYLEKSIEELEKLVKDKLNEK